MITEQRDNMIGICQVKRGQIISIPLSHSGVFNTIHDYTNHCNALVLTVKILKALDAFKGWLSPVKCFEFYLLYCSTFATGTPNVLKSTCLIALMIASTQFALWGHWCWITDYQIFLLRHVHIPSYLTPFVHQSLLLVKSSWNVSLKIFERVLLTLFSLNTGDLCFPAEQHECLHALLL